MGTGAKLDLTLMRLVGICRAASSVIYALWPFVSLKTFYSESAKRRCWPDNTLSEVQVIGVPHESNVRCFERHARTLYVHNRGNVP